MACEIEGAVKHVRRRHSQKQVEHSKPFGTFKIKGSLILNWNCFEIDEKWSFALFDWHVVTWRLLSVHFVFDEFVHLAQFSLEVNFDFEVQITDVPFIWLAVKSPVELLALKI